jgi:hypothetical protein
MLCLTGPASAITTFKSVALDPRCLPPVRAGSDHQSPRYLTRDSVSAGRIGKGEGIAASIRRALHSFDPCARVRCGL